MTEESWTGRETLLTVAREVSNGIASDPLKHSAAAMVANLGALSLAVLGQFWVFASLGLSVLQFHNTWLVKHGQRSVPKAVAIGVGVLVVNYLGLSLAVLGQFWVLLSTVLATLQFWALLRVCWSRQSADGT